MKLQLIVVENDSRFFVSRGNESWPNFFGVLYSPTFFAIVNYITRVYTLEPNRKGQSNFCEKFPFSVSY